MSTPCYLYSPRYLSGTSAWAAHLPFGYDLVGQLKPSVLVELGTWRGDSFFTFCQSVADHHLSTVCYAVDHWLGDGQAGKQTGDAQYVAVRSYASETYPSIAYLMRSDFMAASREFSDSSIDLLHIDGYHTREAVSQDFSTWLPKVRDGGVVLFHDIMVRSSEGHPNFGVWSFWDDLKAQHKTWQFAHGFGLGIFIKGTNEPMSDWFDSATSGERAEYYARRGVDLASISAGKHALEERAILLEQTFKQQSEIARLQRKLEKAEDAARIIKKAVNRWNRRSWLTRACNRLELDEAK